MGVKWVKSTGRRLARFVLRGLSFAGGVPRYRGASEPAVITVGTKVLISEPERYGTNIAIPDYLPWYANALIFNNWTTDSGMEPVILRFKGTASGGSATVIKNTTDAKSPIGDLIHDGFFDGAEVRIYRSIGGRIHLLRTNLVARYLASETSGYQIVLDGSGVPIEAGDIYFLSMICDDAPLEAIKPRIPSMRGRDTWRVYPRSAATGTVMVRRDSTTVAPAHGSRTSLRISIATAIEGGVFQWVAGSADQNVFNAFDPHTDYQVELWLRHQGVADATVHVWLSPEQANVRHQFLVSGEWGRYEFTFAGPSRLARDSLTQLNITFQGPGTIWADNVRLFDRSRPPYAIRPEVIQALKEFQPGTLRIWSTHTILAWGTTLDNWIAPEGQGLRFWEPRQGPVPGSLLNLPTALSLAKLSGAVPWLIVHLAFDETEWCNLIEYLAGPSTSPYGKRRAESGQTRPWTDEFARIRIEYGNETWNGSFFPWSFENGTQSGQFAEYFFGVVRASPYYPALADKLDFIISGFVLSTGPRGYGAKAREASPSSAMICFTSYVVGWNWRLLLSRTRAERFKSTLLYAPALLHTLTDQQIATFRLLKKLHITAIPVKSEGGPGYTVPLQGKPISRQQRDVGRSLAAAVATLDSFLYDTMHGFGPQAFYLFGVGPLWASHTGWTPNHRPHPVWLALQLRNRYGEGAMIETAVTGGPQVDLPRVWRYFIPARSGVSLIAAYTFHSRSHHAIFVLSRHLTLPVPVTIHLPMTPAGATLYTLTGNPRANNLKSMRIEVRGEPLPRFSREHTFVMPPGSVYLFVIEAD